MYQKKYPKKINELVSAQQGLYKNLQQQAHLKRLINQVLPSFLTDHCQHALLKNDNHLILFTDAAAWASRLRFYQTPIQNHLIQSYPNINKISIRITLYSTREYRRQSAPNVPSAETLIGLENAAENTATDSPIKKSLNKLVKTLEKLRNTDAYDD